MIPTAPVLLVAGGTGGHLFPAISLAQALIGLGVIPIIVTDNRGAPLAAGPNVKIVRIRAATILPGLMGKMRTGIRITLGIWDSLRLIRQVRPAAILGFGGYPSLPAGIAAVLAGVPLMLHEQNAVAGRANRLLAPRAQRIFTSFAEVSGLATPVVSRIVKTGNPVRAAIEALRQQPYRPPGLNDPVDLLITGGSQGAAVFSDVVPEAVARLPSGLRQRLRVVQQARAETIALVIERWRVANIPARVAPFFIDIADEIGRASLVIGRAGASTIAELSCAGRPAILVPYPHALAGEQSANARAIEAAGGAWRIEEANFSAATLALLIETILTNPEALTQAAAAAHAFGVENAASCLASALLDGINARSEATGGTQGPGVPERIS